MHVIEAVISTMSYMCFIISLETRGSGALESYCLTVIQLHVDQNQLWPASVAQLDASSDWKPGGRGFNPPPRSATFFRGD